MSMIELIYIYIYIYILYIYIYIYIYIVIHRQTVSLYHNSSVWLCGPGSYALRIRQTESLSDECVKRETQSHRHYHDIYNELSYKLTFQ